MAEGAEKKYLSELDFKIEDGVKSLDNLLTKLEEVSKKSEEISKKMTKDMTGSLGNIKVSGTKEMSDTMKTELLRMEKAAQKHANKMAEIEATKRARMAEVNKKAKNREMLLEKQHQNRLAMLSEKSNESRIAEYAKTFVIYQGFNQLKQAAIDTVSKQRGYQLVIDLAVVTGVVYLDDSQSLDNEVIKILKQ